MSIADKILEIFKPWQREFCPGGQVYVSHKGDIVFYGCFGYADLERNVRVDENTVFHVASVSKQITCMCVLILHERGKLDIDQDSRAYIPGLIAFKEPVTVRDMMNNVSGIRDQWELQILSGVRISDNITQSDLLTLAGKQKSLNFPPRSRYLYSNANFSLLAEIVERVSGMTLNAFAQENIFCKLGMTKTFIRERYDQIIPNRALSYTDQWDGRYLWKTLNFSNVGATSLQTTAADLLKWLKNYRSPVICSPETVETMLTLQEITSGEVSAYACGVVVGNYAGKHTGRSISHDGADAGYRASVLTFPEEELDIVICANVENIATNEASARIADIMLGNDGGEAACLNENLYTEDVWDVRGCAGKYVIKEFGETAELAQQGADVFLLMNDKKAVIRHVKGNCYQALNSIYKLYLKDGRLFMVAGKALPNTLISLSQANTLPCSGEFESVPGLYYSPETESFYEVMVENGVLIISHKRYGKAPILDIGENVFLCPLEYPIRFSLVRNAFGENIALIISSVRVTGILFRKARINYADDSDIANQPSFLLS